MSSDRTVIVGLGEALFDCFDDHQTMGGAPLNATLVAHALGQTVGLRGQMVSRVGRDDLGQRIRTTLTQRGLVTDTLQVDDQLPTGTVQVDMVNGEPHYDIVRNVAWDHIQWDDSVAKLATQAAGITFGTLAQREEQSRGTIQQFLATATGAIRLFDINLRGQFHDAALVRQCCELADAIKLNKEELGVVTDYLQLNPADPVSQLRHEFNLQAVILTHGQQGTELITDNGRFRGEVPKYEPEEDADPVGAGDACGATCLIGLVLKWDEQTIVTRANRVGAFVASRRGATPQIDAGWLIG